MTDSQKEHLDEVADGDVRAEEAAPEEKEEERVEPAKKEVSDPYRGDELKPTWPLLVETFNKWKEHWKLFVGVSVIGGLAMALVGVIGGASLMGAGFATGIFQNATTATDFMARAIASPGFVATIISGAVVIGAVMLIISTWMSLAQVAAWSFVRGNGESVTIQSAYQNTWALVPTYIWISILATVFVVIGVIGFVVPGILLGMAFSLLPMIALAEKGKGMAALRRATALVRPQIMWVVWRFFLTAVIIFFPATVVFGIVGMIFGKDAGDVLDQVYGFLAGPIFAGVVYATYLELKGMNHGEEKAPTLMKIALILGAIAGVLLVGLITAGIVKP